MPGEKKLSILSIALRKGARPAKQMPSARICSRGLSSIRSGFGNPTGVCIALLAACWVSQPVGAAYPGSNGQIAFASDRDGNTEIYRMNANGSAQTRVTDWPLDDSGPAWSPDGQQIAYSSRRLFGGSQYTSEIYIASIGSSQPPKKVTNFTTVPADASSPTWSPDGTRIAFIRTRAIVEYGTGIMHGDEVWVVNVDGTGLARILHGTGIKFSRLRWSPYDQILEGTRLAVAGLDNDIVWNIYRFNADGSGLLKITDGAEHSYHPDWAPDGRDIVFTRGPFGASQIYRMRATGSGLTRLTNNSFRDVAPAWSPDGSRIAFASERNGQMDIYTMNASDGSGEVRLTDNPATDYHPSWQPVSSPLVLRELRSHNELVAFSLSKRAATALRLEELSPGRLARGRDGQMLCDHPGSGSVPPRERCTRAVLLAEFERPGLTGANAVQLREIMGGRRLPTGCLRVTVVARDYVGPATQTRSQAFPHGVDDSLCPK